jgi:Shedu protein SduA, C-terminal
MHKENQDEEFWQLTFNDNSYVLSQVFAVPLVFIKDKAYVGGMKMDRTNSRFVDYVYSTESSREAILFEIKPPTTTLLGSEYRGIRPPARDLAGSVIQVLNYRHELRQNLQKLTEGTGIQLSAFNPRCAVVIGNAEVELTDDAARRSFELYRASLREVEVITYDELFRKVEILAELFGLRRTRNPERH